ncbi:MAG: DNA integrity scanning protein DisA nucleotide-binding domain protein [Betaproteobacteria bacterium]|nr:DNA integrity scanning protein DisA nucleotide-binding domain protein [Betaproteobacteria bacterium]
MPALTVSESAVTHIYTVYSELSNRPEIARSDFHELLDRAVALALSDIEGAPVAADLLVAPQTVDFAGLTNPMRLVKRSSEELFSKRLLSGGQYVAFAQCTQIQLEKSELKAYLRSTGDGGSFLVLSVPPGGHFFAEGLLFLGSPLFTWIPRDRRGGQGDQLSNALDACLHISIRDRSVFVNFGTRRLFRVSKGELEEPPKYRKISQTITSGCPAFFASAKKIAKESRADDKAVLAIACEELDGLVSAITSQRHGATLVFNVDFDLGDQTRFYPGAMRTQIPLGALILDSYWNKWLGYGACEGTDDEITTDTQNNVQADQLAAARRAVIGLSRNDGALVFDSNLSLVGAGVFLRAESASQGPGGARHKSADSFVASNPHVLALVVSQDGPATFYPKAQTAR